MPGRRKHRPFTSLSRRIRRRKVISLKNIIHKERHRCGGIFYDECDFNTFEEEPDYVWTWSDIYFTGLDPATFWNAEIITSQVAFKDIIHSCAFNEACEMLSELERQAEFKIETDPNYNTKGKVFSYTQRPKKVRRHDVFNGLTFSDYVENREKEISHNEPPGCYRRYQFLPGYAYGLGLRMIVDTPVLSRQVIEGAIADFRLHGECESFSLEPFPIPCVDLKGKT